MHSVFLETKTMFLLDRATSQPSLKATPKPIKAHTVEN
jgi:hypothetical protein